MEPVVLRTARLELSIPTDADVDAIHAACQDPDVQRYTTVPQPYERDHAVGFVAKAAEWWAEGSNANWAIREHGDFAGMIGMNRLGGGNGEIGYWLAPRARGRGLLREAAVAVLDWSFSDAGPNLSRVEWRAVAGNLPSARSARALGLRFEGTLRASLVNGGGLRSDGWIAAILPGDDRIPVSWPVLDDVLAG
jgi:RimJ/RimL family protein N-acetyltransferase